MDANSFLMGGGGAPTAKFPTPGTTVGGRITEPPKVEQQRDIKTGEKKYWGDGDPMMQLVVTVQTDQRDPAIEDDDGRRRIFIKGQMKNAVSDAVRAAGARGLEVGGRLAVTYTHDGQARERGMSPPKQYTAQYVAAANVALTAQAPAAAAPGYAQQPPAAPPTQYAAAAPAVPPIAAPPAQYAAPAAATAAPNPVTGHAPAAPASGEPPF